jgi:hypothetical protein
MSLLFAGVSMSGNLAMPTKPESTRGGPADLHMLAHVEKWMATIREIKREQQTESKVSA